MNAPLSVTKELSAVKELVTKKTGRPDTFKIQVSFLLDVSGSIRDEFESGLMKPVLQRSLVFGSQVDPDGSMEVAAFSDKAAGLGSFRVSDVDDVQRKFLNVADRVPGLLWGGTNYAQGFAAVGVQEAKSSFFSGLFKKKEQPQEDDGPKLLIFITDGEDYGSAYAAEKNIADLIKRGYFILAIGVNSVASSFSRLKDLDSKFDGFSFIYQRDFSILSQQQIYELFLTDEFVAWLTKKGLI